MSKDKEAPDIDYIYNRWINGIVGPDRQYKILYEGGSIRYERFAHLFLDLSKHGISYEDAMMLERRVLKDFYNEDVAKKSKDKDKSYKTWKPNIKKDFVGAATEYYDPNSGIIIGSVVYTGGKFKIPRDEKIVKWVTDNFGDSKDLIEEAHNMNSMLCMQYYEQLMNKEIENKE